MCYGDFVPLVCHNGKVFCIAYSAFSGVNPHAADFLSDYFPFI